MKVKELVDKLLKCDPESEVDLSTNGYELELVEYRPVMCRYKSRVTDLWSEWTREYIVGSPDIKTPTFESYPIEGPNKICLECNGRYSGI